MKHFRRFLCALILAAVTYPVVQAEESPIPPKPTPPAAQSGGLKWHSLNISGSFRFRTEAWDWYGGNAENTYGFNHALLKVDVGQNLENFDWHIELAAPVVFGLPDNAVAPGAQGAMGLGANYYTSNDRSTAAASVFPRQAYARWKFKAAGNPASLRLGRFEFVEGTETTPSDPVLAAVKRDRIANRILGNFAFALAQRSFDGAQISIGNQRNFTLVALRPTRGVFQVDGLGELDIGVIYGAWTMPFKTKRTVSDFRVFGMGYDDVRPLVKVDNRPAALKNGDLTNVRIGTFGAHYITIIDTAVGKFDVVMWGAGQFGSWGALDHRASAAVGEFGWQPKNLAWRPWFRAGYSFGSGDANPTDGKHTTFFQMLATPRLYARFPFYNMQNNEDAYAVAIVRPTKKLTLRSELHTLRLAERNDLWYQGGGPFQPRSFGYTGRPGGGNQGLANVWDIAADYQINQRVGVSTYFANSWGKGVIDSVYPKRPTARFGYVEMTYKF